MCGVAAGGFMEPTILYAASDGVWKNYPCEVPPGTNFEKVYLAVEQIIEERPQFLYKIAWSNNALYTIRFN